LSVFVVLAQATSGTGNRKYPAGEIHGALAFVNRQTEAEAEAAAVAEFESAGWVDVRLRKIGRLDPEFVSGKEPEIQGAFESAVQDGTSLIIYQNVDDGYAA
jgi:hypothetical protein